jgi:hypothetical protein
MSYKDDIGKTVMARDSKTMTMTPAKFMYYDEAKERYVFWCLNHKRTFHGDSYIMPDEVSQ